MQWFRQGRGGWTAVRCPGATSRICPYVGQEGRIEEGQDVRVEYRGMHRAHCVHCGNLCLQEVMSRKRGPTPKMYLCGGQALEIHAPPKADL